VTPAAGTVWTRLASGMESGRVAYAVAVVSEHGLERAGWIRIARARLASVISSADELDAAVA
jgi:hypothetical protein